jgi:hypothetical protein
MKLGVRISTYKSEGVCEQPTAQVVAAQHGKDKVEYHLTWGHILGGLSPGNFIILQTSQSTLTRVTDQDSYNVTKHCISCGCCYTVHDCTK